MAHSSSEDHHQNCAGETMQMDKELERMIEDVESISVQLTWMAYDMVVLRTDPDLGVSLRKLEEEFLHCRAVICGSPEEKELNQALRQEEDQGIHEMERRQRTTEQGNSESTSSPDLAFILKGLDSMSAGLERLAIRSELRLCDLIVCFSHADKTSFLNRVDEGEPAGPRQAE